MTFAKLAGAAAALLFSIAWISIMKHFARQLIIFTMIASIVWCIVLAIVSFHLGSVSLWLPNTVARFSVTTKKVAGGIIFILLAVLTALFFWFARSRIPFATAVLKAVALILQGMALYFVIMNC